MLNILIEEGADVSAKTNSRITPFMLSLCKDNIGVARILVKHGADTKNNCDNRDPNFAAYCNNDEYRLSIVKELVSYGKTLSEDEFDMILALHTNNLAELKSILERSPDINVNVQTQDGLTPLMFARSNEAREILLSRGALPNVQDKSGQTVLHRAVDYFDVEGIKFLLSNGADITIKDNSWNTAFSLLFGEYCMISKDTPEIMKIMLAKGADANSTDVNGMTPLMKLMHSESSLWAEGEEEFSEDMKRCIEVLLAAGADVNARDKKGNTAFIHTILFSSYDRTEIMKFLLSQGADPFIKNNYGNNALDVFLGLSDDTTRSYGTLILLLELGLSKDLNPKLILGRFNSECEYEPFFVGALSRYDVESVKSFLEEESDLDPQDFVWHFVENYIPEADNPDNKDAISFKFMLDKGSEILRLLHEEYPEIPSCDSYGQKLSYVFVEKKLEGKEYDYYEFLPLGRDCVGKLRRAVSPVALEDTLEIFPDFDVNAFLTISMELRLKELSESFNEAKERFRASQEFDENESLEEVFADLSSRFSPQDFVEDNDDNEDEDEDEEETGTTLLHVIARDAGEYFDPAGMINLLFKSGANVNLRDDEGSTPLAILVSLLSRKKFSHANLECAYELIKAGSDFDIKNKHQRSFRSFLNLDIDDKFSGRYFMREFLFADIMQSMINCDSCNAELLIVSCGKKPEKIIKALSNGADINTRTQKGYSPIMIASVFGTEETIKTLIDNGADINLQNSECLTALMIVINASKDEDAESVAKLKFLLSRGADVNMKAGNGESALKLAVDNADSMLIKILLLAGADYQPLIDDMKGKLHDEEENEE